MSYTLSADLEKSRVGIYKNRNITVINEIEDFLVVEGEGIDNTVCGNTLTFALYVSYVLVNKMHIQYCGSASNTQNSGRMYLLDFTMQLN